ncbi:MAG: hypothetical protein FJ301_06490 [Planctomycetes bacterium]|nr:hypothetical protein [Planctomycetota bacterium]
MTVASPSPLRAVRREALGGASQGWAPTLRRHLVAMDALVRARGARMVLLTYPFHQPEVEAVQRAVASELSLPIVDVRPTFDRLVAADGRARWFVPDGHCNDAGYAQIAELAAPVVAAALRR